MLRKNEPHSLRKKINSAEADRENDRQAHYQIHKSITERTKRKSDAISIKKEVFRGCL